MPPVDIVLMDIHLPEPVGVWPFSWQLWLVLSCIGVCIALCIYWHVRRRYKPPHIRAALKMMRHIRTHLQSDADVIDCAAQAAIVIRRVVLTADTSAARLSGDAWWQAVCATAPDYWLPSEKHWLLIVPFQKTTAVSYADCAVWLTRIDTWLHTAHRIYKPVRRQSVRTMQRMKETAC